MNFTLDNIDAPFILILLSTFPRVYEMRCCHLSLLVQYSSHIKYTKCVWCENMYTHVMFLAIRTVFLSSSLQCGSIS